VAVREHGWHRLGTVVDRDLSVAEAMELAHLADLDYTLEPLLAVTGTVEAPKVIPATGYRAVVRKNPWTREPEVIGAGMTDTFTLHTPEEALGFGEQIIDMGKPLAALGSINSGRRAFAAFAGDEITIGGHDQVRMFLNVMTAFDGSMATVVRPSAIRVVCANTFSMVMGQSTQPTYRVRHMGAGLADRVDDARAALDIGWKGMEAFQAEAEAMLNREVSDKQFNAIVEALLPFQKDATPRQIRTVEDNRAQVHSVWNGANIEGIKGTAWGALNAYTEWTDWVGGRFQNSDTRMVAQITPGSRIDTRRLRAGNIVAKSVGLVPA
jgi:phage/plasmid-like protein (TIGR03299 family)